MIRSTMRWAALSVASAAFLTVACSTPDSLAPNGPLAVNFDIPGGPGPVNGVPEVEWFEICKVYAEGTGPDVTVDIAVDRAAGNDTTFQRTLASGQCQNVWIKGGAPDSLIATEVVPAGYTASVKVLKTYATADSGAGSSGGGLAGGSPAVGTTVIFVNTLISTPGGGEGCTPGYWKQRQHFDSYPAPYAPTTLFGDVFENAFPGKTLVQVAAQGGGGLNALGRHTVAALLNAASTGVSYDLTTAEVISSFNAAFPGGDYNALKDVFEDFNEQGCPLN